MFKFVEGGKIVSLDFQTCDHPNGRRIVKHLDVGVLAGKNILLTHCSTIFRNKAPTYLVRHYCVNETLKQLIIRKILVNIYFELTSSHTYCKFFNLFLKFCLSRDLFRIEINLLSQFQRDSNSQLFEL